MGDPQSNTVKQDTSHHNKSKQKGIKMGKQHQARIKRIRRKRWIERKKAEIKSKKNK